MLQFNRISTMAMVCAVALAACTEGDGTGVNDEVFDPVESAADLEAVQEAFSASMFESLNAASPNFNLVPDAGQSAPALIQAGWNAATANSRWEAEAAALAFAAAGPSSGPLLHLDFRGRTYARDGDNYYHDAERTDAPDNGVRFILYEVDPVTGAHGDSEVGYVDIIDESTDAAYVARVIVVTGGVEHINYTVSATIGTQSVSFTVSGFIGNGTDVVDVDLSMTFDQTDLGSTATVHHLIAVPTRDFEMDATAVFTFDSETQQGSVDIDGTFMQGARSVSISALVEFGDGDGVTEGGSVEISVDGQLFAVVTIVGDNLTVRNADGGELTAAEAAAVRRIFHGFKDVFEERFEDFLRPVSRGRFFRGLLEDAYRAGRAETILPERWKLPLTGGPELRHPICIFVGNGHHDQKSRARKSRTHGSRHVRAGTTCRTERMRRG